MNKLGLLLLAIFILAGCTLSPALMKTDIQPYGPDTYTLTVTQKADFGTNDYRTQGELKSEGIGQAQAKCSEMNKQFMPIESTISGNNWNLTYDLTFRCLDEGDPELKRPEKGTEVIQPIPSSDGDIILVPPFPHHW